MYSLCLIAKKSVSWVGELLKKVPLFKEGKFATVVLIQTFELAVCVKLAQRRIARKHCDTLGT